LAIELGLVEKSGSFFTYKETKIQGKDKMKAYLESNSEIMAELEVRIKEKIINGEVEADEELDFDTSSFDLDSLNLD
jgi:hypothetical protein